jgi:lipoprotein-anchoring transpeptidase ErfK/SrfK
VPTDPVSVLVDLDTRWLLCLEGEEVVASWPVGVGRVGEETIAGRFTVGEKQENPPWFPAGREMIPFGDPRNPLGTRWRGWFRDGVKTSYGIHGTKDPTSIGKAESDGCIRLRNEDVEALFELVPLSSPILVQE